MADGYTSTGPKGADVSSKRLFCEGPGPPGPDGDDTDRVDPVVTAFAGLTRTSDGTAAAFHRSKMSNINASYISAPDPFVFGVLGTNDFSIEFWVKRLYPDSITNWVSQASTASGYCFSGVTNYGEGSAPDFPDITTSDTTPSTGLIIRGQNFEGHWQGSNVNDQTTLVIPMGWHHIAFTYDRDGNMVSYVDGVSQGTITISSDSSDNFDGGGNFYLQYMDDVGADAQNGKVEVPYLVAGFAIHDQTILTTAQIQDSVSGTTVQKLANTLTACFANQITLQNGAILDSDLSNSEDGEHATVAAEIPYPTYCLSGGPSTAGAGKQWATVGVTPQTNFVALRHEIYYDTTEDTFTTFAPLLVDDPSWPPTQGVGPVSYA